MRLLRPDELAPSRGERLFRESSVETCALLALLLAWTAGCAALASAGGATGWLAALLGLPSFGASGLVLVDLLRDRHRRGWVLSVRAEGIALATDASTPGAASVLWLPRETLASARRVVEVLELPERRGGERQEHRVSLELTLRTPLRTELSKALLREAALGARQRRRPRLELVAPERLRMHWRCHGVRLTPGIEVAVEAVESLTRVSMPAALERTDFRRLSPASLEHQLRRLAVEGRLADAASILRAKHGWDARRAHGYVASLLRSAQEAAAPALSDPGRDA